MHKKRAKLNLTIVVVSFVALIVSVYFYVPQMFADTVYPLKYQDLIMTYSKKYNVDQTLLTGVIMQESRFNPNAVSSAGAQGLMQFMPSTATTMAKETGRWPNYNIFDAETSIEFGAAHIRDLLNKYDNCLELALYAYNNGTGIADNYSCSSSVVVNSSYVTKIKKYRDAYAAIYAEQLEIEARAKESRITKKDKSAAVRGFVWSQIFNNIKGSLVNSN